MSRLPSFPLKQFKEIQVSQILFDHSDMVSLWGSLERNESIVKMDYLLDFNTLNKLLRFSGKIGDEIQMLVVSCMENGLREPSVIDLEESFGGPVRFDKCIFRASHPKSESDNGVWKTDTSCLFIEEVQPLVEFSILKIPSQIRRGTVLKDCLETLANLYELFLGYQELDYDEETARSLTGLKGDWELQCAFSAWKSLNV